MKKSTLGFVLSSLLCFSASVMVGQNIVDGGKSKQFGRELQLPEQQQLTPSGHVRCHTTENEAYLQAKYPKRATTAEFEAWLAPKVAKIKADRAAGKNIQTIYNIPVVIHIVHDGDCIGTGENITDAQAISQITVMNQDYRRMAGTPGGANSTGLATDCEINFVLAKRDPSGNPSTGVVRHNITPYSNNVADPVTGQPDWETNADVEAMKAATIWDPTLYLNMWTIRPGGLALTSGGLQGLLGYAQFPDATGLAGLSASGGAANTDGVVAGFDAMGTIALNDGTFILNSSYNLGRTMTHEVGHWLGLRHIWGDNATCPATNTNNDKDYCADTPAAAAANYTCTAVVNSCTANPGNDMTQNYMDYTYDNCMDTFTPDQKVRIQAIMAAAARRSSLNSSNGATAPSAGIYFDNKACYTVTEGTNCNYTDVNYPVSIIKAPTANSIVTFNVSGGTATNNVDFQIMTPTVTFAAGSTTSQNLTIRYFNDGIAESSEGLTIGMTVNAAGGDAAIIPGADTASLTLTIVDNDVAPIATQVNAVVTQNFEALSGWTTLDGDADGKGWGLVTGADGIGTAPNTISGKAAYSEKSLTYLGGTGSATAPNNFLISPQFTLPTGITASEVTYIIAGYGAAAGKYTVYFTTDKSSVATITAGAVLQAAATIGNGVSVLKSHNLLAYAGQTGYIVFRHTNNAATAGLLLLDTFNLTATVASSVQTEVNTATAYQATIPSAGTFYAKDGTTSKIMLSGTNNSAFDYGCTNVSVTRSNTSAGVNAVDYGTDTATNLKVMAKSFTVTPTTNNAAGNDNLVFYFSESEISSWETATGNNRSALKAIKVGNSATLPVTIGAFGTGNVTLATTVANGISGVYYFGIDRVLANQSFDVLNGVNIYPNPATNELNINLGSGGLDSNSSYSVYNTLGQSIITKKISSESDLKVNTSNYSNGIYLITIQRDGKSKTIKFIKQ